ncbi:hypothetical protein ZIOFF_050111 [Zingiber officinale]|uniref:Uncharacterized protein n=1 Tax=Zingiber officinale TaxID=94328 RepID=A0A8J5FIC8_ZINOF|nr:hypothetical protein ZIOFF_050111 [Zingiber officinale]
MAEVSSLFGGKLDILVNNAGTGFVKPMALITPEEYKFIMSTNVDSTFHMSQLAYPLLKDSGGGAVVDNSSLAGILGIDNFSIYGTAKGDNHDLNIRR